MKRIYLSCSTGMSTSMLASGMQGIANSHDPPIEVGIFPDRKIGRIIDEKYPDVVLLGPQVKYRYDEIVERYGDKSIPIQVIDQMDYSVMNGEKVLRSAIKLTKSAK